MNFSNMKATFYMRQDFDSTSVNSINEFILLIVLIEVSKIAHGLAMTLSGAVVGHSFVTRLGYYLQDINFGKFSSYDNSVGFKVNDHINSLSIFGKSGAFINNFSLIDVLCGKRPDFLIIDLGSNDLTSSVSSRKAAKNLFELANETKRKLEIQHVTICGITYRADLNERRIEDFNNHIKKLCKYAPGICYHKHKNLNKDNINDWSRDKLHPNSQRGKVLYYKSIRRAIFQAIFFIRESARKVRILITY